MYRDDWVSVVPPAGERARVEAELLALAQHPGHVRTAGSASEFIVPPYLADAYTKPPAPRRRAAKPKEGDE